MSTVLNSYHKFSSCVWHQVDAIAKKSPNGARALSIPLTIESIFKVMLLGPACFIEELCRIPQGKNHLLDAGVYAGLTLFSPLVALIETVIMDIQIIKDPVKCAEKRAFCSDIFLFTAKLKEDAGASRIKNEYCSTNKIVDEKQIEIANKHIDKAINIVIKEKVKDGVSFDTDCYNSIKQAILDNVELKDTIQKEIDQHLEQIREIQRKEKIEQEKLEFADKWDDFKKAFSAKKEYFMKGFLQSCAQARIAKTERKAEKSAGYRSQILSLINSGKLDDIYTNEIKIKERKYNEAIEIYDNLLKPIIEKSSADILSTNGRDLIEKADSNCSGSFFYISSKNIDLTPQHELSNLFSNYRAKIINASGKLASELKFNEAESPEQQARMLLSCRSTTFANKFSKSCVVTRIATGAIEKNISADKYFLTQYLLLQDEVDAKNAVYLKAVKKLSEIAPEDEARKTALETSFTTFLDNLRKASLEDAKSMEFVV